MTNQERHIQSVMIAGIGLLLGAVGDLFFYHYPPGVNVVLYMGLFLLAGAVSLRVFGKRINLTNALFVIPALFFAAMFFIISAGYLAVWNALLAAGALFLVVRYLTEPDFMGGGLDRLFTAALETCLVGWLEPLLVLEDVSKWARHRKIKREHTAMVRAVARGCLIALPILAVFAMLLSSADIVFSDFVESLIDRFSFSGLDSLFAHTLVIGLFAWGCTTGLKIMIQKPHTWQQEAADSVRMAPEVKSFLEQPGQPGTAQDDLPSYSAAPLPSSYLGMIESGIVLGSVDMLFLVFVLIQARYLFGGEANITRQGYTYAEYARRGFFELLAVSIFSLLLMLVLDHVTERSGSQERLFRALVLGVIGLTLMILASAFQRLNLYEEAYGFTRLRVVSHVFMVWLALLFVIRAVDLFRVYPRLFWLGSVAVTFGFFATLNLLNVDAFIASRNIERFHDTGKLDIVYLTSLSDDAVPAMATLLDELDRTGNESDPSLLATLAPDLHRRLRQLDDQRDARQFLGYHYGKDRAWKALDKRRDILCPAMAGLVNSACSR